MARAAVHRPGFGVFEAGGVEAELEARRYRRDGAIGTGGAAIVRLADHGPMRA